jgi:DNA-binding CsgD family transcriptional regulator
LEDTVRALIASFNEERDQPLTQAGEKSLICTNLTACLRWLTWNIENRDAIAEPWPIPRGPYPTKTADYDADARVAITNYRWLEAEVHMIDDLARALPDCSLSRDCLVIASQVHDCFGQADVPAETCLSDGLDHCVRVAVEVIEEALARALPLVPEIERLSARTFVAASRGVYEPGKTNDDTHQSRSLTPFEAKVLNTMSANDPLTAPAIATHLRSNEQSVRNAVSSIRKKLGDDSIVTHGKRGYTRGESSQS